MQKNIYYKILTILFCVTFSCAKVEPPNPFLVSHLPHIQLLEKKDHGFCASLKIDFDIRDDFYSDLYWRCRISLAKYKIRPESESPYAARLNLEITDLISKISLKLAASPESILMRENKKMDERQHQKCLDVGYEIATEDQAKIDDYFACRRALIDEQQLVPAFGNEEYEKYRNYSYDISFAINQRIDKDILSYKEAQKKYPTCIKFDLHNINFKKCRQAQDISRACLAKTPRKIFRKDLDEKIICQRKSYARFPDKFLKDLKNRQAEIDKISANSNFYNNNSLASLGLDIAQFGGPQEEILEEEIQEIDINNKDALYSKFELTKLRQRYIFACQTDAEKIIVAYGEKVRKECHKLAEFEVIGEYTRVREK